MSFLDRLLQYTREGRELREDKGVPEILQSREVEQSAPTPSSVIGPMSMEIPENDRKLLDYMEGKQEPMMSREVENPMSMEKPEVLEQRTEPKPIEKLVELAKAAAPVRAPASQPETKMMEDDKDYQKLRDEAKTEARNKEFWANAIGGIGKMLGGFAGVASGQKTPVKSDMSNIVNSIRQNAKQDIETLNKEELHNANSNMSINARDQLSKVFGINVPDNMSAAEIQKFAPTLINQQMQERAIASREKIARAKEDRYYAQREKEEARRTLDQRRKLDKELRGVVKDFERDDVVKALRKQGIAFDQADGLLDAMKKGNKVALGALGTKMARAMGEVGVLTDADVVRYIQRFDVSGKVLDYFSGAFKGKTSDLTAKDLKDINYIMQTGARKKLEGTRKYYIEQAYQNFGKPNDMSYEDVEARFGKKISNVESKQTQVGETVTIRRKSDGATRKVPKDKVEKYLSNPNYEEVR